MKNKNGIDPRRLKAQKKGRYAELLASWLLRLKGYQILENNYKTKVG
ncbi:hypothetical protein [Kiloniella sp.]